MAYTTATFTQITTDGDGTIKLVLRYTGDAGEPAVESSYPVNVNVPPTADYMRALAMARITLLNRSINFRTGATPFLNTVLDTTTPLPTDPVIVRGAFMAASAPFTPGATPQDVFTIMGSASKTIRVVRMGLSGIQTTAGLNAWSIVKRSTANSGGTSALLTAVPTDDSYPAATATVRQYTANPTAGVLIGSVWSGRIMSPILASTPGDIEKLVCFSPPIVLSGITDVLAWNFGGVALPTGLSVQARAEWDEF